MPDPSDLVEPVRARFVERHEARETALGAARSITERTRGDLTNALGQRRLREALDAHRAALEGSES